jgi:transposase
MSKRQPKVDYWQASPMPRGQLVLFPTTLEDRIPADHPVRAVDEMLDRLDWSEWEAKYNGRSGQPPIHPSILCKVLLFAILRGIRSSRKIEYEVKHSIDFIWLVSGRTLDHSTLSAFRRDHQKQVKKMYRDMVRLAIELGVAKLSELCIDGTRVLADANRYKTLTAEKAQRLLDELEQQIASAMKEIESSDELDELFDDGQKADALPEALRDMKERHAKLDEMMATLAQMDAARSGWVKDAKKNPAQLPITDPDSRILPNKEGGYAPNYTPMAVTDEVSGMIVGADVLTGNVEHTVMGSMVDTVQDEYGVTVETMMGDTAYACGENLTAMEQREVELLAPLAEPKCKDNPAIRDDLSQPVAEEDLDRLPKNPQTKRLDKSAFIYDEADDCYYCPTGKKLPRSGSEKKKIPSGNVINQANYTCYDCAGCALADRCRKDPNAKKGRKIVHDENEPARRRHRQRMATEDAKERYTRRQHAGETPFAVIKACFGLRRFLLRGIEGVQTEWLWHCSAFNLKRMLNLLASVRADDTQTPQLAAA